MASFWRSLFQPIYAAFYSIWDGFFATIWLDGNLSLMDSGDTRPPWNETFLLAAPWPGLFLSMAIAVGLLRGPLMTPNIVKTPAGYAAFLQPSRTQDSVRHEKV
jgi:hypothetical protein